MKLQLLFALNISETVQKIQQLHVSFHFTLYQTSHYNENTLDDETRVTNQLYTIDEQTMTRLGLFELITFPVEVCFARSPY